MLITLMFSVVAKKSMTFSSFSYSAHEQVCRSWEVAQPGRAELVGGNIPYPGHHAQLMNGGWPGGRNLLFPFREFKSFLFREFMSFLGVWLNLQKSCKSGVL